MPSSTHLAALADVYRDADALFAGWACPSSTECCRFGITGREPYVTSIELEALLAATAKTGIRLAAKRHPRGLRLVDSERRCPLLDDAGRCIAYAARPLGCRTFYCDRASPAGKVKQRELNELVRRVRDIASAHTPRGDLGRALTHALGASSRRP